MKGALRVTFGGSGFDRRADLRKDPQHLDHLLDEESSHVLPVWRGKPLITGQNGDRLGLLRADHPVFADAPDRPVFLGLGDGAAMFAREVSAWAGPLSDMSAIGAFIDDSEQTHPSLTKDHRFAELRQIMTRLSARDAELAATAKGLFEWHAANGFCAHCGHRTDVTQSGWQRLCAACGRQHFPRVDPVVIMLITHGNDLLIGRSPAWPDGMYSLLAGFMEPGETIEAAVRREVFEESGIIVGDVSYLAGQPWPFPASLMIGMRGTAQSTEITLDPVELEDARWVSREDIADAWASRSTTLIAARKGAIAHYLIRNWLSDTLD